MRVLNGATLEVYEKDGRLWQRHLDVQGKVLAEGPSRVQIVNDPKIRAFQDLIRQPAVSKGLQRCKSNHSPVEAK